MGGWRWVSVLKRRVARTRARSPHSDRQSTRPRSHDRRSPGKPASTTIYSGAVRLSSVIRATAWGVVAAGVAAPLAAQADRGTAACDPDRRVRGAGRPVCRHAPLAHARRDGVRPADVGVSGRVQDSARRRGRAGRARAHRLPDRRSTACLASASCRRCACSAHSRASIHEWRPRWRALDKMLVWAHWAWFMVPHGSLAYILVRHPERFPRAATMTYAVFDLGASIYWLAPTAPPWYAASVAGREGPGRRTCAG